MTHWKNFGYIRIALSILFLSIHVLGTAQQRPKEFSREDFEAYTGTVVSMFTSKIPGNDQAIINEFTRGWDEGLFSDAEKTEIIQISNILLEKKLRNIQYTMFWQCLLDFKKPENTSKGYEIWMKSLSVLCENRRTTATLLQSVMQDTHNLLTRRYLASSAGNIWKTSTNDYHFELRDEQIRVVFGTGDIICYAQRDSIVIGQTAGHIDFLEQKWEGQGGTVTWERAGFSPGELSARLGKYTVNMKQANYEADSVMLIFGAYFSEPVAGKLIDRVRHNQSAETAIYPEFVTYGNRFVINDLYPNISYEGGLRVQGARTLGSGTNEEKAKIHIRKGDSIQIDITSKNFVFRSNRINSSNASLAFYIQADSIYHPNLSFVYLVDQEEISMTRTEAASSQSPYANTYHRLYMNVEQLVWNMNDSLMSLSIPRGASQGRAEFRSRNYFNRTYYEQMQYMDVTHPLLSVQGCAAYAYSNTFTVSMYAQFIRKPVSTARSQLIEIAKLGFISYDSGTDAVTTQPMLYDFIDAASNHIDFDIVNLRSQVNAPQKNATLNMRNYHLQINGLQDFMVSDSQYVVFAPAEKKILVKKGRSIDFNGKINAGQLELYGKNLHFDYDTFKISLRQADSMFLYVPTSEKDTYGKPVLRKVQNSINQVTGSILIDLPDNKSGRKSVPNYPILYSDSVSRVYYGSKSIAGGAYDSKSFYFELDAFVMDSIDHLSKEMIVLPGKFSSADIFADMRQELKVQPDYSLGFTYETGDSGILAYNDSKMFAEVSLSSNGLAAGGQLDYLTASIHSEEFQLYPDSTNALGVKEFLLRKQTAGTEYPEIRSEGNDIHWEPKKEQMFIYKSAKDFNIYDPETHFDGYLILTPGGLGGNGLMKTGSADISSARHQLKSNTFSSDSSIFRIKSPVNGSTQMITADSVRSNIDFNQRQGQFTTLHDYALVRFPANKFAAYIDDYRWDMDSSKVHIGIKNKTQPPKPAVDFAYQYPGESNGSRFYSTAPAADSLNFVAVASVFDYHTGKITAEGISLIRTADAIVFPGNGKAVIGNNGNLESITGAQILFDEKDKRHTIHSANVTISGRNKYEGNGKYDYVDETGKISEMDMTVASDNTGITVANGTISEASGFMMSPFFRFQGKTILSSVNEYMEFDGVTQIVEECESIQPDWFSFKAIVNPEQIRIPVDEAPVNKQHAKIYNGLFLTNDSTHIYPAFFSRRKNYSDHPLIQAHGMLSYDKDSMIYFIAPETKLENRDTVGNLLAFDRDKCLMRGEGQLSLGIDLGRVSMDVVGNLIHNMNTQETSLHVMMSFDFLFHQDLASTMAGAIEVFPGISGVDMSRSVYMRGMNQWLGVAKANAFRREAMLGKVQNFPAELNRALVITQLNLKWNPSSRSYRSTGKIGIGNIFGFQINRLVDGMIEISKRSGGDFVDIYLKLDDQNWYYFGYTRELMQIISSDQNFNDKLMSLPEKQRKIDDKKSGYTYMIASRDKLNQFLSQYQQSGTAVQSSGPGTPTGLPPARQPENVEEEIPVVEIQ